jgi:hypothetical protein
MDTPLALVTESTAKTPARRVKIWRERPVTEEVIFKGTDDCGRSGWFLRLMVSGLYPRRVGPYRTKGQALNALESFVYEVELELFCNLHNEMRDAQVYVVEGVPQLIGSNTALVEEGM